MPSTLVLPEPLQVRLNGLPQGLQNHIGRVRVIARELAAVHAVDQDLAELAAANDLDAEGAKELLGKAVSGDAEALGRVQALVGSNANASGAHDLSQASFLAGLRSHTDGAVLQARARRRPRRSTRTSTPPT